MAMAGLSGRLQRPATPRPVVHITTYPPEHCGVGDATNQMIRASDPRRRAIVLGNVVPGAATNESDVHRVWKKGDVLYPLQVLLALRSIRLRAPFVAHVQHHFFLYGGPLTVLVFPILLIGLRAVGCKVVTQLHSIVDYKTLSRDIESQSVPLYSDRSAALLRWFYRTVEALSDRIIVWTRDMRSTLVNLYGLSGHRIAIVPHGWRAQPWFHDPDARETLGLKDEFLIVFHGFLDPTKGLEDLLHAFSRIAEAEPAARLCLVGEVSPHLQPQRREYQKELRTLASSLGIADRVWITGYVEEKVLNRYLSAASLIVLPYTAVSSLTGSGVLAKVAAFGKPLIASNISRFASELHSGREALLVDPGNVDELATAIRKVAENQEYARYLGENLRRLAPQRTWECTAELVERIYAEIDKYQEKTR